jgi:DNA polymerase/3'-5' exonuclease PolX
LDNPAIARILREVADLLEIKGENPFKIRAYRNCADIAGNHPHELSQLDEAGLREIPGIGKDLAARIREISQTGDAAFHRELLAEFSACRASGPKPSPRSTRSWASAPSKISSRPASTAASAP